MWTQYFTTRKVWFIENELCLPARHPNGALQIPRLRLMTKGRADDRFSAAPTALGSSSGSISQPFRAGLTFGGRPSGPCIYGDLAVSFLPQLAAGKSAARDDKERVGFSLEIGCTDPRSQTERNQGGVALFPLASAEQLASEGSSVPEGSWFVRRPIGSVRLRPKSHRTSPAGGHEPHRDDDGP